MSNILVPGCDAVAPSIYQTGFNELNQPIYSCRCMVCARCNKHTGNTHQGHFWSYCSVTHSLRDFHFCCTDDCELEVC